MGELGLLIILLPAAPHPLIPLEKGDKVLGWASEAGCRFATLLCSETSSVLGLSSFGKQNIIIQILLTGEWHRP